MEKLEILFEEIFNDNLKKAVFSAKRLKSLEYTKVEITGFIKDGRLHFQATYVYPKKVTHLNLAKDEMVKLALNLISCDFKEINIFTTRENIQVLASKPENPRITRKANSKENILMSSPDAESESDSQNIGTMSKASISQIGADPFCQNTHNRQKNYIIKDGVYCDFLVRLGIMGRDGKVFPKGYDKFRQINRYLEIVEDVYPYLDSNKTLKIIDFGCGKAYLTFALYYYLRILKKRKCEIIGLDLKKDVINFCSSVKDDLGYSDLNFLMGDIVDYTDDHADMVVTLHACDTATDYALINAVNWGTKVILSVPCCQHELFKQIDNDIHNPMLKHGILKDRLTEYLTDGLRALKLEEKGYDVNLIEFTSLEHTARNIMIKAVKSRPQKSKMDKARAEYLRLRDFYHVNPTIDKL